MHRFAAFILLLLYAVSSSGATFRRHYCMGEIAGSSFWKKNELKCRICGMVKNTVEGDGCCKVEVHWLKITDAQKAESLQFQIAKLNFFENNIRVSSEISDAFQYDPPDDTRRLWRCCKASIYILNCTFRV